MRVGRVVLVHVLDHAESVAYHAQPTWRGIELGLQEQPYGQREGRRVCELAKHIDLMRRSPAADPEFATMIHQFGRVLVGRDEQFVGAAPKQPGEDLL